MVHESISKECGNQNGLSDTVALLQKETETLHKQLEDWKELFRSAQALIKDKDAEIARLRTAGNAVDIASTTHTNGALPAVQVKLEKTDEETTATATTTTAQTNGIAPSVQIKQEKPAVASPSKGEKPITQVNGDKPKQKKSNAKQNQLPNNDRIQHLIRRFAENHTRAINELEVLYDYSHTVQEVATAAEDKDGRTDPSYDAKLLAQLIKLMPRYVREKFDKLRHSYHKESLEEFGLWVHDITDDALDNGDAQRLFQMQIPIPKNSTDLQCLACGKKDACRSLQDCAVFRKMTPAQRWDRVMRIYPLCYTCLKNHDDPCTNAVPCGVGGCSALHHWLLHIVGVDD